MRRCAGYENALWSPVGCKPLPIIRLAVLGVLVGLFSAPLAFAQNDPAAICGDLLREASRNLSVSTSSSEYLNTVYSKYCDSSGKYRQSGFNAGLAAVVESLPVKFTLGTSNTSSAMENFCKTYYSEAQGAASTFSYTSRVIAGALDNAVQCVRIARTGNYITHRINSDREADIQLSAASGNSMTIQDVHLSGKVSCEAHNNKNGQKLDLVRHPNYTFTGNLTISCDREPASQTSPQKATLFDEATVSASTNDGPYSFTWPRSVQLAPEEAAAVKKELEFLEKNITATNVAVREDFGHLSIECQDVGRDQLHGPTSVECPAGWVVVSCNAGKNLGSFNLGESHAPNGCWNGDPHLDWIQARCCHVVDRNGP